MLLWTFAHLIGYILEMDNSLKLLKQLVKIPSVTSDKVEVNRCADFVASYLKEHGLYVKTEHALGYNIVYAATEAKKRCNIMLNAHIDVVPAADNKQFIPIVKGGKLFGRGASDCKGNVVLIMNLLARLKGKASVGAIFTSDEENGGYTAAAMAKKGYGGRFTLVFDGNFDRLLVAQKGILSLRLKASGRSCHASTPWRGDNPIDKLIGGYAKIKQLFPSVSENRAWNNTAAATVIRSGSVANQIPDTAEMVLNIRFIGGTDPKQLKNKIEKISGLSVLVESLSPFVEVSEKHPFIKKLLTALKKGINPAVKIGKMNGATDMRHFLDSEAIAVLGLKGHGAHASDEWLLLNSLPRLEEVIYNYILNKDH